MPAPYVDTTGLLYVPEILHDVTSGHVTFINQRQVLIENLTYDGLGPGARIIAQVVLVQNNQ